jgi:hypothetical protein
MVYLFLTPISNSNHTLITQPCTLAEHGTSHRCGVPAHSRSRAKRFVPLRAHVLYHHALIATAHLVNVPLECALSADAQVVFLDSLSTRHVCANNTSKTHDVTTTHVPLRRLCCCRGCALIIPVRMPFNEYA